MFWLRPVACGILKFPNQGSNLSPVKWKIEVLTTGPPASPEYASFVRNCQAVSYTGCILTNNSSSCSCAFSLAFGGVTFAYFQIGPLKKLSFILDRYLRYILDRSPLWNRWFANILPLVVSCFRDFFSPQTLFLTALGLHCCMWAFLPCGTWASHSTGFSCSRAQALATQALVVVACRC